MNKNEFKLYADENISKELVDHLREDHHLNIHWVKGENQKGVDDSLILQKANDLKSFLLTNDDRFVRDHHKFPFKNLIGIIKINEKENPYSCLIIKNLCSHRSLKTIYGKKFIISKDKIRVLSQEKDGTIIEQLLIKNDCPCNLSK